MSLVRIAPPVLLLAGSACQLTPSSAVTHDPQTPEQHFISETLKVFPADTLPFPHPVKEYIKSFSSPAVPENQSWNGSYAPRWTEIPYRGGRELDIVDSEYSWDGSDAPAWTEIPRHDGTELNLPKIDVDWDAVNDSVSSINWSVVGGGSALFFIGCGLLASAVWSTRKYQAWQRARFFQNNPVAWESTVNETIGRIDKILTFFEIETAEKLADRWTGQRHPYLWDRFTVLDTNIHLQWLHLMRKALSWEERGIVDAAMRQFSSRLQFLHLKLVLDFIDNAQMRAVFPHDWDREDLLDFSRHAAELLEDFERIAAHPEADFSSIDFRPVEIRKSLTRIIEDMENESARRDRRSGKLRHVRELWSQTTMMLRSTLTGSVTIEDHISPVESKDVLITREMQRQKARLDKLSEKTDLIEVYVRRHDDGPAERGWFVASYDEVGVTLKREAPASFQNSADGKKVHWMKKVPLDEIAFVEDVAGQRTPSYVRRNSAFMHVVNRNRLLKMGDQLGALDYHELFAGDFSQGNVGNCYLISAFKSLKSSEETFETLMRVSIVRDGTNWLVRIPLGSTDGELYRITPQDLEDQDNSSRKGRMALRWNPARMDDRNVLEAVRGPLGYKILEAAYCRAVNAVTADGRIDRWQIEGGNSADALKVLLGSHVRFQQLGDVSGKRLLRNGYTEKVQQMLANFHSDVDILSADTRSSQSGGGHDSTYRVGKHKLHASHSYSVREVVWETIEKPIGNGIETRPEKIIKSVLVNNPWLESETMLFTFDEFLDAFRILQGARIDLDRMFA